jgi:DNA-binding NarL/FixJ family response regulator
MDREASVEVSGTTRTGQHGEMPEAGSCGTRVVVADREPTVRGALRALVTQGLDMQVVGEAGTAGALQRQVRRTEPQLVIVAWDLIGAEPEEALRALRGPSARASVVVLDLRPETRRAALAAGADGFISMVDAPDVVSGVLRSVRPDGEEPRDDEAQNDERRGNQPHDETSMHGGASRDSGLHAACPIREPGGPR